MFGSLKRFQFKMKVAVYAIVLIIVSLLAFGLYVKFRTVQSVGYIEHQSASVEESAELLEGISQSLAGIEAHLAAIRLDNCLQKAGFNQKKIQECESAQ